MQVESRKKSTGRQAVRTARTRAALIAAARRLFASRGYAETATPDIVREAGVTRGALYHHFQDKRDLFRAVLEAEQQAIQACIEADTRGDGDPLSQLMEGSLAFFEAAADPGTKRIVFLDGPAVLGWAEWREIDGRHATRALRDGLDAAMRAGMIRKLPLDPLTGLLSAAFNEAALGLEAAGGGYSKAEVLDTFRALFEGLRRESRP